MIPILVDLGFIKIYTLGVFLVVSFFWGMFLLWKNIKMTSYKEEDVFDGLFLSLFGALLGARLIYVAGNFGDFQFDVLKFLLINGYPGLSLIGGLVGFFLTFALCCRSKNLPFFHLADYMIFPLFVSLSIAKVGSLLAGVDVGTSTSFLLSMQYAGIEGSRHLVGLYEALLCSICAFAAYKMLFIIRRDHLQDGSLFFFFIGAFSLVELLLDNLKQNHIYFADLSFNLLVGVIGFVFGGGYFLIQYKGELAGWFSSVIGAMKPKKEKKEEIKNN